jgi:hypothetical protein
MSMDGALQATGYTASLSGVSFVDKAIDKVTMAWFSQQKCHPRHTDAGLV